MFYFLDILGTVAFAISGALVAMNKRLDLFGILIIGLVTAIGGGTLRDLLIGKTPVSWMLDMNYAIAIFASVVFAMIFKSRINYLRTSLFLFDTIGIGLYTVIGIEKGIQAELHPVICVALGTISACFGGVLRDILCNDIPVIFQKEIYATACIIGGAVYFVMLQFSLGQDVIFIVAGSAVILIRLLAVKFNLVLPKLYSTD
ncbi:MAG: trimeric intracellular cation channel family protein [bacterium]